MNHDGAVSTRESVGQIYRHDSDWIGNGYDSVKQQDQQSRPLEGHGIGKDTTEHCGDVGSEFDSAHCTCPSRKAAISPSEHVDWTASHYVNGYAIGPVAKPGDVRGVRQALSPTGDLLNCYLLSCKEAMHYFSIRATLGEAPWLGSVVDVHTEGKVTHVFTEATHGTLLDDIGSVTQPDKLGAEGGMADDRVRSLFTQILDIIAECHRRNVVLVHIALMCFGFADKERTQIRLLYLNYAQVGDVRSDCFACRPYCSPEVIALLRAHSKLRAGAPEVAEQYYSGKATDIWSLGVVLYVMLTGLYPFHPGTNPPSSTVSPRGTLNLRFPKHITASAASLVMCMLELDPMSRRSAFALQRHTWLSLPSADDKRPSLYGCGQHSMRSLSPDMASRSPLVRAAKRRREADGYSSRRRQLPVSAAISGRQERVRHNVMPWA